MRSLIWSVLLVLASGTATADHALLAVATNFNEAAVRLKADFEAATGHNVTITTGSTGKLYAQIMHGAPYDTFLAADQDRPTELEQSQHGVPGTRFTYAVGRLALWSARPDFLQDIGDSTLTRSHFKSLAIANPELAPYGAAARETLNSLNQWQALQHKIVMGENIGQTYALIATQNAELGFVSLASLDHKDQSSNSWIVPQTLHRPIRQDAVLLKHGSNNAAARAFLEYLASEPARMTIASFGYDLE